MPQVKGALLHLDYALVARRDSNVVESWADFRFQEEALKQIGRVAA